MQLFMFYSLDILYREARKADLPGITAPDDKRCSRDRFTNVQGSFQYDSEQIDVHTINPIKEE